MSTQDRDAPGLMREIISDLQEGVDDPNFKWGSMRAAEKISNLYFLLNGSLPDDEETNSFKRKVSDLLRKGGNPSGLTILIGDCYRYAERGRLDGFHQACLLRSKLQVLQDEFVDLEEVVHEPDRGEIAEIDELLEEVSDDAPPVPEKDIPNWLPDSHWWWRAPKQQDMSHEERMRRILYDENDWMG
ncbi:hypothetical protein HNR23_004135 [Nocardiopsis mwathae]|uniref:Uncharacterized protein n=1 Tax=Nocardiopsis mwathae TaxID=1472723 RepID=A0A7W9YLA3_9ACTN|nr:hypothetical protein [Nocardiopsis mwathae]MBB6174075.1 hypothetical protein [Nocardiopsis mwathae]